MENKTDSLPKKINLRVYDLREEIQCPQESCYGHHNISSANCFKCEYNANHKYGRHFNGTICTHPDTEEVKGRKLELRVNSLGEHWYE